MKKALLRGVELRGLEPLTPTLPERLAGVSGRSRRFICGGQATARAATNGLAQP
jgi:hypothetical protein